MDRNATVGPGRAMATVLSHLETSAAVMRRTAEVCGESITEAEALIIGVIQSGGKLLLCGNGGSAADAQHLAAELVGLLDKAKPRAALPAIALGADAPALTSVANDSGFASVFERQIEAIGRRGDALLAISTSGDSPNIVRAAARARAMGIRTVALTGRGGGSLASLVDVVIDVPSENVQHIQEAHIAIGHVLCALIEDAIYPERATVG